MLLDVVKPYNGIEIMRRERHFVILIKRVKTYGKTYQLAGIMSKFKKNKTCHYYQ